MGFSETQMYPLLAMCAPRRYLLAASTLPFVERMYRTIPTARAFPTGLNRVDPPSPTDR